MGALLRSIDAFEGQPVTRLAMQLAPHVFVRPGELRASEWAEFDFTKAIWRISAERTKKRKEHVVPLSRQSIAILEKAKALTGYGRFVFPSVRSVRRPLSENTINAILRRLGYAKDEMTAHGFRSVASTLLNESGKWSADAIERVPKAVSRPLAPPHHGEPRRFAPAFRELLQQVFKAPMHDSRVSRLRVNLYKSAAFANLDEAIPHLVFDVAEGWKLLLWRGV